MMSDPRAKLFETDATFSPCRTWRYMLTRCWATHLPILAVIGLNPSTADETRDDPTIRRIRGFAELWGYGGLHMLNLFALRSTDPRGLRAVADPVGPENDAVIVYGTAVGDVLCCWGTHGFYMGRDQSVLRLLRPFSRRLLHLGLTKDGHPKHPLYLRGDTAPQEWTHV